MKNTIIIINTILAAMMISGCTTGVEKQITPINTNISSIEVVSFDKGEEKETAEYTVIKEGNAADRKAVAEAARKAEEEKKAAEEAAKAESLMNNQSGNNVNNNTSNNVNNNTGNNTNNSTSNAGRSETTTVRGISLYVAASVSTNDYNNIVSWINNMPSFLIKNVSHIYVVDNIAGYNPTGQDVSGFANGDKIYVKASGVSGRKGTLYHEAAHILDRYNGYSSTATWSSICSTEWSNEGHYSSLNESFAEAVSRYYVDGLSKSQSKTAISNLINTGNLGSNGDGFSSTSVTLYGGGRAIYLYSTPSDRVNYAQLLQPGSSVQAIGVNSDGSWYKVDYQGATYYTPAYLVSLNP